MRNYKRIFEKTSQTLILKHVKGPGSDIEIQGAKAVNYFPLTAKKNEGTFIMLLNDKWNLHINEEDAVAINSKIQKKGEVVELHENEH